MKGVVIEAATWRDLRALHALEKACFGRDAWPWIDLLAALTLVETVRLKAVVSDRMVGFIIGDRRRHQGLGWIATLGVHPDCRRQGIGRRLLTACERQLGMRRVRLTLRQSNVAAYALYRGVGYSEVDVWQRYYRDGEDGIVMEKVIES
jgi:ribosomal protein S18 acetylase RimI-like enzyme